jgi:uncharacterized protein
MNWNRTIFFTIGILASGVCLYGFSVEPKQIEFRHAYIRDSALGKALEDKVIVHLTDLHIGKITAREERVLEILDHLKPDLILLTGDYVQWRGGYEVPLEVVSRFTARVGTWAVMGDYDYSNSRKSCLFCHAPNTGKPTKRHNVKFLRNEIAKIDIDGKSFWIGGLDFESGEAADTKETLNAWKGKTPAIILSHSPLAFDRVDEMEHVLMLAGDTHGGQIPLPSWLWKILGYEKNAKYSQGLYEKGKAKMYVSRGIGTSHVPFRFLRRPEVVVLHFEEGENAGDRSQ